MAVDPGTTPSAPADRPADQANSQGTAGNRSQRRQPGGRRGSQQRNPQNPRVPKCEGRTEELAGHIYDYANSRQAADKYTKTTHEICEYLGRTLKHGADTMTALETLAMPVLPEPADPTADASRAQLRMWEKMVDTLIKRESELEETATQLLMDGIEGMNVKESFQFAQVEGRLPKTWILLDNQSTVNIFYNKDLLQDVKTTHRCMRVRCNAGWSVTNMIGRLPGYPGEVWYNPQGIANILSLADAEKHYRVRYDSHHEKAFIVEKPDGSEWRFKQTPNGLYYLDTAPSVDQDDPPDVDDTMLVNTVADKQSKYTARAYRQAVLARKIQKMVGYPSTRDFMKIIDQHLLPNCPITRSDIAAAEDIFGPAVSSLKGKTMRRGEPHVPSDISPIPRDILLLYRELTLCVDIMYVNKLPFLVTLSRAVKFGTIEFLNNRREDTIGQCIKNVMRLYGSRGFLVTMTHADGEFEVLRSTLAAAGSGLNVCSHDEHVPEVERYIRTIKERARCLYNSVPFTRFPVLMIKEMVTACVFWLNMFPPHDGVSTTISPRALMTGYTLDYHKHCRLEFGSYVQTHEDHDNSMQSRTTGAIALCPTGIDRVGITFSVSPPVVG